jgi:hypothetical protein
MIWKWNDYPFSKVALGHAHGSDPITGMMGKQARAGLC